MHIRLTRAAEYELAAALDRYDRQGPDITPRFVVKYEALHSGISPVA